MQMKSVVKSSIDFGASEREFARLIKRMEKDAAPENAYYTSYFSPLGELLCVSNGNEITALLFSDWHGASELKEAAEYCPERPEFALLSSWLDSYFSGKDDAPMPKFMPSGTSFQRRVWELIAEIPKGETLSYGDIAKKIAHERGIPKMAAQAVGNAVAANKITILIPCHRVVASNGKLGGYGGHEDRKLALLRLEGAWKDKT